MTQNQIDNMLFMYGQPTGKLLAIEKGYRNESHKIILQDGTLRNFIVYKNEQNIVATIKRANTIGDYLADQGMSARRTANSKILTISGTQTARYGSLYYYLSGTTIPWETYTMEHIKCLGSNLARMHELLHVMPSISLPFTHQIYADQLDRMISYWRENAISKAAESKLGISFAVQYYKDLQSIVNACRNLEMQPLHMDFVRGNILFDTKEGLPYISGILDFEKASRGNVLFDIARTTAFLLVDCKYKTVEQIRKYFLHSGYCKRGNSSIPKVRVHTQLLLECLIDAFLLHDLYKFMVHNPYEYLDQNEHYIRTRDICHTRKLITYKT